MTTPLAVDFDGPVTDGFRTLATFIPRLLGALALLLLGYLVARLVATLVDKALERAGFDRAVEKGGIRRALAHSSYDASDVVAMLVFFAIFIPFVSAAVSALGISALQAPMAQVIALIPRVVVAIVLVVVGAFLAGAARSAVAGALGGLSYAGALATAAYVLVLVGFVKSALDQVGIATTVTTPLLYTVLAIVAGVTIVGAGGGLIKPMQHRWEDILNTAGTETRNVRAQAQAQRSQQAPAHPADPGYPADPAYPSASGPDVEPTGRQAPAADPGYGAPTREQPYGQPNPPQYPTAAVVRTAAPACVRFRTVRAGVAPVARAPGENRTPDALLRTEALYPLSYGGGQTRRAYAAAAGGGRGARASVASWG